MAKDVRGQKMDSLGISDGTSSTKDDNPATDGNGTHTAANRAKMESKKRKKRENKIIELHKADLQRQ